MIEDKKLEDEKLEDKKLDNKKLEDKKLEDKKLDNKKLEDKELDNKKLDNKKLEDKKLEDKKLDNKKLKDKKLEDKKLEDEKLEDKKIRGYLIENLYDENKNNLKIIDTKTNFDKYIKINKNNVEIEFNKNNNFYNTIKVSNKFSTLHYKQNELNKKSLKNKCFKEKRICINCNKNGHTSKMCNQPIISFGVINIREINNEYEFLMICRKDSFTYVDFLRGKYDLNNCDYIKSLIDGMTLYEKNLLLEKDFNFLWNKLWLNRTLNKYNNEFYYSKTNFDYLKNNNILKILIENSRTKWEDPEWGFPKGKRNLGEEDLKCAIREFEEETGLKKEDYNIIENLDPLKELFYGTNGLKYKHIYYISYSTNNITPQINIKNENQITEISDIKWLSLFECLQKIRNYNYEKIKLIKYLHSLIKIKNLNLNIMTDNKKQIKLTLKTNKTDLIGFTNENNYTLITNIIKNSTIKTFLINFNNFRRPSQQIKHVFNENEEELEPSFILEDNITLYISN